jgi:hypothetical protein
MSWRAELGETCWTKSNDDDMGHRHILYEYVGGVFNEVQRRAEKNQPYSGARATGADNTMTPSNTSGASRVGTIKVRLLTQ